MNNIADLINDLCDKSKFHENSCDVISSSVQTVHAPVSAEQYRDLLIISSEFKRNLSCLAGDLPNIAIREAFSSLPEEEQSRLKELEAAVEKHKAIQKNGRL